MSPREFPGFGRVFSSLANDAECHQLLDLMTNPDPTPRWVGGRLNRPGCPPLLRPAAAPRPDTTDDVGVHRTVRSPKGPRVPPIAPLTEDDVPRILIRDETLDSGRGKPSSFTQCPGTGKHERLSLPHPESPTCLDAGRSLSGGCASGVATFEMSILGSGSPRPSLHRILRLPCPLSLTPGKRQTLVPLTAHG